jgi:ABC-type dipeptide/oligopeptide/nickel transport system permease component
MFWYVFKRLLWAVPTWFLLSVLIFSLSQCASGDAVKERLSHGAESFTGSAIDDATYLQTARELGLDKPIFYFSILPKAFDSLQSAIRQLARSR